MGPEALILTAGDLEEIKAQALATAPAECCGILAGEANGRVTRVFPMVNTCHSADEFFMEPDEQFTVFDAIQAAGLTMLAVYHSHPQTPARPSEHDIRMAYYPDMAYLIVSLAEAEPCAKAFRIVAGEVRTIPLRVTAGPAGVSRAETRALHAGQGVDPTTGARATPIYLTTSYVFPSALAAAARFSLDDDGFIYTRMANPTTAVLEERVAALEGGVGALATASGQAAELLTVLTLAESGENIVSSTSLYGGTWTLFLDTLRRMGIEVRFVPVTDRDAVSVAIDDKTRAVYCETIGNPDLEVADIAGLAGVAHAAGVPLVVDNTFAGPFVCRPLVHGADIVVESLTKYAGGHGTVIGGIIVDGGRFVWDEERFGFIAGPDPSYFGVRFAEHFAPAGFVAKARLTVQRDVGACISPFNSFTLLQGIETMHLRCARHGENALRVAEFLDAHPAVERVAYPGLPNHSTHAIAAAQFEQAGFGGMVCFDIRGGVEAGRRFIDSVQLLSHLANVGDAKSLVVHPASTTHAALSPEHLQMSGVRPGYIRLSVGLETADDIIADIAQALERA